MQLISNVQASSATEQLRSNGYYDILRGQYNACKDISQLLSNRELAIKSYVLSERNCQSRHIIYSIVNWLNDVAETSDGICRLVSHHLPLDLLMKFMMRDPFLPSRLRLSLHHLYITLMSDQDFKRLAAIAYAKSFSEIANSHAAGIGSSEHSLFGLSVQFLNRESIVVEISSKYGFLYQVMESLSFMLRMVFFHDNLSHPILIHRRLSHMLSV